MRRKNNSSHQINLSNCYLLNHNLFIFPLLQQQVLGPSDNCFIKKTAKYTYKQFNNNNKDILLGDKCIGLWSKMIISRRMWGMIAILLTSFILLSFFSSRNKKIWGNFFRNSVSFLLLWLDKNYVKLKLTSRKGCVIWIFPKDSCYTLQVY